MLSFLILILVIFILWPVLSVGWKLFRQFMAMRRFMRDPMGEMHRQAQEQARRHAAQQRQQTRSRQNNGPFGFSWFGTDDSDEEPRPRRRGKKIPADIGEYVPFQEITVSESELHEYFARTATAFKTEEQITDIKWTDL